MTGVTSIPPVRAIVADPRCPHSYFVFADGQLLRVGTADGFIEAIADVPTIDEIAHGVGDGRLEGKPLELRLHTHGRWVVVAERFGLHAALIDTDNGAVRPLSREDYHADVSSYSIGFLERDGRTLLIAQTQWNRLDVFDAETGANLTEREVSIRDSGRLNDQGHKIYDEMNYVDYFHSALHVSPDSSRFLSNGWVWSPADMILAFSTDAFLTGYEPTGVRADVPTGGYNWDRPCAFVDDQTFVLALDDGAELLDEDEIAAYRYHQLAFFTIPKRPQPGERTRWLKPTSLVDCEVFTRNEHGEVKGELHYDPASSCLIALTETHGTFVVTLTGQVVAQLPEISCGAVPIHADFGSRPAETGWSFDPRHRVCYRWRDGIEEHALPALDTGASTSSANVP